MSHCDKCGVDVSGDLELCPLCQARLSGEAEPSVFPHNEVRSSGVMALRVLAFATGVGILLMAFLGHVLSLRIETVLAVWLALATNYAFVRHVMESSPDFLRLIARYFLLLLGAALLWFVLTDDLVVTTFVVPSICLTALVVDAVLLCVFRGRFVSSYAKYLLFDILLGVLPMILAWLGLVTWDVLAYASALVSGVLLLGLVMFARDRLLAEVRKLFTA